MDTDYNLLINEVRKHLDLPDVIDFRQGTKTLWACPPIETGMVLGELNLDDYNKIQVSLTDLELIGVYEEFVHGYLAGDELASQEPRTWLCRRLGLGRRIAQRAFPPHLEGYHMQLLTMLLWVIKSNLEGATWSVGWDYISVEYAGRTLGYVDGKLLSAYPIKQSPRPIAFDVLLSRHSAVCGQIATCVKEINYLKNKIAASPFATELDMAIRILVWSGRDITTVIRMVHRNKVFCRGGAKRVEMIEPTVTRLKAYLDKASEGTVRPLLKLRQVLVPIYLSPVQFQQLFGNAYRDKLTERNRVKWLEELEKLAVRLVSSEPVDDK